MSYKIWAYIRTSTTDQTTEQQKDAIVAAYPTGTEFEFLIEQVSGWEGKRPEYDLLKKMIARGSVKELACFSISRLGRNVQEAGRLIELCQSRNVKLKVLKENLDFTGGIGYALFSLFAALAQMESDTKSQAIKAKFKLKREKEGWKCHGTPPHTVAEKIAEKAETIYMMHDAGRSNKDIARTLELTDHTVGKVLRLRGYPMVTRKEFGKLFPGWQNMKKDELPTLEQVRARYREVHGE